MQHRPVQKIEAQIRILNNKLRQIDSTMSFGNERISRIFALRNKISKVEKELQYAKQFEFLAR